MKAQLKIEYDIYDGTWAVTVFDYSDGEEIFFNRTNFKLTAWVSFFVWKYIRRKFKFEKNVCKDIEI